MLELILAARAEPVTRKTKTKSLKKEISFGEIYVTFFLIFLLQVKQKYPFNYTKNILVLIMEMWG